MTVSGKNTAAAALVALFAAGCAHGPTPAEQKMQADLTEIKAKLDRIEKKLDQQADAKPSSSFRGSKADPAVLAKIVLPPNPTKAQITDYINKILNASRNQNSFSNQDIQVEMLAKVGENNLDLLIAAIPRDSHRFHIIYAIKQLASVKSKAKILKYLDRYPELIESVEINGWENDAREILLAKLNTRPKYLPPNWIKAVIKLNDSKAYPGMIEYFINGINKGSTYEMIKNLPGIKITEAVTDAWKMARMDQEWDRIPMAIIAVQYGHLDALETLIDNQKNQNQYLRSNIRQAILTSTDAFGSPDEITQWFKKNKANLVFDPITKKFKVKAGKTQPPKTAQMSEYQFHEKKADPAALAKIVLPPNPTKAQITDYINKIIVASKDQNLFSTDDVQVKMLMKVGEKNLDLLITSKPPPNHQLHVLITIQKLTTEQSKSLILKYLDSYPSLAEVVIDKGWEKDAREILLAKLAGHQRFLHPSWIKAIVILNEPDTYPDLIEYFINGANQSITYEEIKKLPGIKLDDAVAKAWKATQPASTKIYMARVAVQYGHLDALEMLIDNQEKPGMYNDPKVIRQAILTSIDAFGSPDEITQWFKKNKANLVFDPITKKFKVKAGNDQPQTAKEKRP